MEQNQNTQHSPSVRVTAPVLPYYPVGKREGIYGVFIAIFSILLANSLFSAGVNLGFALSIMGITVTGALYLHRSGCKGSWYSWALLGLSGLIIPGYARSDDSFVKFVISCFLFVAVNTGLCDLAGKTVWDLGSVRSLSDGFRTAFSLTFGKVSHTLRGFSIAMQNGGAVVKNGTAVLLGLAIAIPVLVILIPLLMSADAAFQGLLELLPEINLDELLITLIFGIGIACLSYTRCVALCHGPKTENRYVRIREGLNILTVNTVLGAVCVVYGVYLFSQLAYFAGGFAGILPEEFTVAQYARRGFFEMAWICLINLSVMIGAISLTQKQENRAPLSVRLLCLFIGMVTLFLVVAAGAKMVLYIGSFGMTRLRVLTMVVMVFLGLTTAVIGIWLFAEKLPYMKVVVLSAMILGAAVLWTDVDSMVSRYNVDRYLAGTLESVDIRYLKGLGSGAVPQLDRLARQAPDKTVREKAAEALTVLAYCQNTADFRNWNYTDAEARRILEEYRIVDVQKPE